MNQNDFSDKNVKNIYEGYEEKQSDEEILEGEIVEEKTFSEKKTEVPQGGLSEEEELKRRIEAGEWDNLDDLPAFKRRMPEGQIMTRAEAIDIRIRQLETKLPLLLNKNLTAAYVQMLKRIRALRMTKTGMFAMFYKDMGQKDLDHGK